jgi:general secretion pathway protein H
MRYLSNKGFTLIELIVVLIILSVASAIAVVSVGRAHEKRVFKEQALRVQGTLRQARDISLLDRIPVTFALEEEDGKFWLEKDGVPYGRVRTLPEGFELAGEDIVFLPKGNSTGGFITVKKEDGRGYAIEVDTVTGIAKVRRF